MQKKRLDSFRSNQPCYYVGFRIVRSINLPSDHKPVEALHCWDPPSLENPTTHTRIKLPNKPSNKAISEKNKEIASKRGKILQELTDNSPTLAIELGSQALVDAIITAAKTHLTDPQHSHSPTDPPYKGILNNKEWGLLRKERSRIHKGRCALRRLLRG